MTAAEAPEGIEVRLIVHVGIQIRGKRFSKSSFNMSRASSRSVFFFRPRFVLISAGSPIQNSKLSSASSRQRKDVSCLLYAPVQALLAPARLLPFATFFD